VKGAVIRQKYVSEAGRRHPCCHFAPVVSANPVGSSLSRIHTCPCVWKWGSDVRIWRAPWKGGAFQWVQVPPGKRSSRKQPEQLWR